MTQKTVEMKKEDIGSLPDDKPVVYNILDLNSKNIYTGCAKRGQVQKRIRDHLKNGPDPIPGATKVKIRQMPSIENAKKVEANVISRIKPRFNKRGK